MRRFSPDGKRVHAFDKLTGKFRFSGTKRIAAEIEFYTMTTKDGASERWIESRLAEIDAAVRIFGKLERGEAITREERWRVALFIGFADSRGPGFRSTTPPLSVRDNPEDDEAFLPRSANALAATTGRVHRAMGARKDDAEDVAHLATRSAADTARNELRWRASQVVLDAESLLPFSLRMQVSTFDLTPSL